MLLSGIYYGKTPIMRAYKGGEIIWSTGTDKYIGVLKADIQNNIIAYITDAARECLCAGDNVELRHIAIAQGSESECVQVLESCLFTINTTLNASKSNLELIDTSINNSVDVTATVSPIKLERVDGEICFAGADNININQSERIVTDWTLHTDGDVVANISRSDVDEVDENISINPNVLSTISPSERIDINNDVTLCGDAPIIVDDSDPVDIDCVVETCSYALERSAVSQNSTVQTRAEIQIDTDLIRSPSKNGDVQDLFSLEKDAVLNVLKVKNGVAEQIATLENRTQGTVAASVASVISAMSLIDSDVHALVQNSVNGKVQVESDIELNSTGSVSKTEIVDVGAEEVLNSISSITSSKSIKGALDDICVHLEDVATANICESVISTVEQGVVGELLAYARVQGANHAIIDVCETFFTDESIINISPKENIQIYNMHICVDSNGSMRASKENILSNNAEVNVGSNANMRVGIIFKTLLDESFSISSNNNMNIILPIDMIVAQGLRSGADAPLIVSSPTDVCVTHSVQSGGAGNITMLAPLKLLLEDYVRENCDVNLVNQNTHLMDLDNYLSIKTGGYLEQKLSLGNIAFNCDATVTPHAILCFWQFPVVRGDNLFVRQALDVDEYPGGLTIY